jgi:predicted esterase YcpF (UPF0227 family)
MNILYLHGLLGSLSDEKRKCLEVYGKVIAPQIPYESEKDCIAWLFHTYKNEQIDVIIGSSLGGFAGYYLSQLLQKPALLFNPALAARSVEQHIPKIEIPHQHPLHFVLGANDEVVDPKKTLNFIAEHFPASQNYHLQIKKDLSHRIPISVFEDSITTFFKNEVNYKPISKKYLFLDDLRTIDMVYEPVFAEHFDIVRTYDNFVNYIQQNGLPGFISFDNDLGLDKNGEIAPDGYAAAKWLVYESGLDLSSLQFSVHSANPVAADQIRGLLYNYLKFLRKNN